MLKNIHLKNLALIEEADIDLKEGLNIMTGETGSGKSIIIGSVNIALGEKANKQMIRRGSSFGLIELLFTSSNPEVFKAIDRLGIERDSENILITRKITPDSSVSKINGETVTLSNLKKVTSLLVDVHGQHDHESLLNPAKHVQILDDFGKNDIKAIKNSLAEELASYKELREKFKAFDMDEEALEREVSLLEYEADEIENAALGPEEDKKLEEEYKALEKARSSWQSLSLLRYIFDDEANGLVQKSSEAMKEINEASKADSSLLSYKNSLADIDSLIKDFSRDLNHRMEENGFDEQRFMEVSERLDQINRLKNKYGNTLEEIESHRQKCRRRLKQLESFSSEKENLSEEMQASKARINSIARDLSSARKKTASVLEPLIIENLKDLNFLSVEFKIDFKNAGRISKEGFDQVEFMISLNPGEPLKPLSEVASGGELSRIMLSLKSSLAQNDHIETLIFDEIDSGISGKTAARVADKMKALSRSHQIICITHLPQIAAKADSHYLIEKETNGENTISGIRLLSEEESEKELARMISADEVTQSAIDQARELKKN